jgi:hypothetical protein
MLTYDDAPDNRVIEIPLEPRLSGTRPPPVLVQLPLVCRPRRLLMAGYAGLLNLLALIAATAAIATLLMSPLRPAA